ncbi:MAG: hypothetical protein KGN76_08020 [Acidobacteriota bacterium]|nr:hypothetical protein [Acidobacteriota bacterium]
MKCILLGGSGEVGGAVARALIRSDVCSELTMIGRRTVAAMEGEAKVRQAVVDTSADDFEEVVKETARGHDVAISCIGIGSGTARMSEAQMMAVEVQLLGRFARGCKAAGIEIFELLTAVGIDEASAHSKIKFARVLGRKYQTVLDTGFRRLAVFKPGMIVGNAHTPGWLTPLTALIPDALGWGNIRQEEIGQAFATHLENRVARQTEPVVSYENREMKRLVRERHTGSPAWQQASGTCRGRASTHTEKKGT